LALTLHWLPNAISVLRILLVVPIAWMISTSNYTGALYLFFVAGLSDGLDGFLAKTFSWQSRLGALLDPVADKLLLVVSFVALATGGLVPLWLAVLVVARDAIIVGGATAYHFLIKPVDGEPTMVSKINTAVELAFVLTVLFAEASQRSLQGLTIALGAAVMVTVVVSGIDYVWSWSVKARRGARRP